MLSYTVGVPQSYTHWFYFASVRISLSMKSVSSGQQVVNLLSLLLGKIFESGEVVCVLWGGNTIF